MGQVNNNRSGSRQGMVRSEQLLGEKGELVIVHGQSEYRLRLTRQGKLILTK